MEVFRADGSGVAGGEDLTAGREGEERFIQVGSSDRIWESGGCWRAGAEKSVEILRKIRLWIVRIGRMMDDVTASQVIDFPHGIYLVKHNLYFQRVRIQPFRYSPRESVF